MTRLAGLATLTALLVLAAGCGKKQASLPPPLPPLVDVGSPTLRYVTEYEYFTGRTDAAEYVEIRAQVAGMLKSAPVARSEARHGEVKEGDDVEKGRRLFLIDPVPFEAEKERQAASIKQYEALARRLESDYKSAVRSGSAVSEQERIRIYADLAQAKANLQGSEAALKIAEINLGYTRIAAPFDGRLGRRMIDPGNIVKANDTMLTTIVRLDPMHAYFDVDERTVLRFREMLAQKQIESSRTTPLKVHLALANEPDYKREGEIDFVDNRLDPSTGTLRIRVETPNQKINGMYYLSPGMFIRLRLPVGKKREALLVPETALASKQGQKVLYVVRREKADDQSEDKAVERVYEIPVEVGHLESDGWRVLKTSGRKEHWPRAADAAEALRQHELRPGDRIVTSGLQRVRDQGEVRLVTKKKDKDATAKAK